MSSPTTFTDAYLRSVVPPKTGRLDLTDTACRGLTFRVTDRGAKSWSFRFRDPTTGQLVRMTIGPYPEVSLRDARLRAGELRSRVAHGENPVIVKQQAKQEARAAETRTFEFLAQRYLDRYARPRKRSAGADERNLRLHVLPKWGKRRYDQIKREDVIELIDGLIDTGKQALANRVQQLISKIYSFALDEVVEGKPMATVHPCFRLRKKGVEQARQRVLSDDELRAIWRATEAAPRAFSSLVQFILCTATRRSEAAHMQHNEVAGDDWIIPSERYKTGTELLVPLSPLALQVLAKAPRIGSAGFVFTTGGRRPLGGYTWFKEDLDKRSGVTGWTIHDLRRTARSLMSRAGVPTDHAERALGHTMGTIRGTYDRHDYAVEKRRAFEALAGQIERIVNPPPAGATVVPMRTKTA